MLISSRDELLQSIACGARAHPPHGAAECIPAIVVSGQHNKFRADITGATVIRMLNAAGSAPGAVFEDMKASDDCILVGRLMWEEAARAYGVDVFTFDPQIINQVMHAGVKAAVKYFTAKRLAYVGYDAEKHITSYNMLLAPVHASRHWFLLQLLPSSGKATVWDSAWSPPGVKPIVTDEHRDYVKTLVEMLIDQRKRGRPNLPPLKDVEKWSVVRGQRNAKQDDEWSCGWYVIEFGLLLCQGQGLGGKVRPPAIAQKVLDYALSLNNKP